MNTEELPAKVAKLWPMLHAYAQYQSMARDLMIVRAGTDRCENGCPTNRSIEEFFSKRINFQ
jgi:hypothetical protein